MKLRGTVDKLEDAGNAVTVTLTNVHPKLFLEYDPGISFRVSHYNARRSYPVGTVVAVHISPCPS